MQDIHPIAGGRVFSAGGGDDGGGSVDRRLRSSHHHLSQPHQALKCPRCDSLDTKFCYYNNYNLSQPRHFCKNCRRYWTEGGVLRNVPVGGGCRKAKRSKPKSSAPADPTPIAAEATTKTTADGRDRKTSSHSSSERSRLAATTRSAAAEAVSATTSTTPSSLLDIDEYESIITQSMNSPPINTGFNRELLEQSSGCGLFSEMGNLSSLIASSAEPLPFGFGSVLAQNSHWIDQKQDQEQKIQQEGKIPSSDGGGFLDQTVQVDLPALQGRPSGNEAFGLLDWQPSTDQGLFDLPGTVDQAYWSQNSQWADEDHQPGPYLP